MSYSAEKVMDEALDNYNPGWQTVSPPFDARYPHQNQMVNCLRNFLDYYRCKKIKGEDYVHCNYFKRVYLSKCPQNMVAKWEEQMEAGTFKYPL